MINIQRKHSISYQLINDKRPNGSNPGHTTGLSIRRNFNAMLKSETEITLKHNETSYKTIAET